MRELIIFLSWFGSVDYLDCIDSLDSEGNIRGAGCETREVVRYAGDHVKYESAASARRQGYGGTSSD